MIGYGNSGTLDSALDRSEFLAHIIETLSPDQAPIIVSPSMSGSFSLRLLINRPGTLSMNKHDLKWPNLLSSQISFAALFQ